MKNIAQAPPPTPLPPPPQPAPALVNPWLNLPPEREGRTSLLYDQAVFSRIHRVYPKLGVLQATIAILLTKLTNELERAGLTEYDAAAYTVAVNNATIVLGLPAATAASGPPAKSRSRRRPSQPTEATGGHEP